ncbi:MAG: hypothetical protein Q9201_003009 [Fulgogasparrea decipioides]
MASTKRKILATNDHNRPSKKSKPSTAGPNLTLLPKEEPSFPRGGASVLTPLEQKQIQIQAKNDVLFEQSTGKKASRDEYGTEGDEGDVLDENEISSAKVKRNTKRKGKLNNAEVVAKEKTVRIEGLSYKRLVPGSMVLGQVSQINQYDIALSLPNNLTGYIPITSLSDRLTIQIESLAEKEKEEASDDESSGKDLDLKAYFFLGQYLRAYVVATETNNVPGQKARRHIELSINPRQTNLGLRKADLVINSMVQASVRSVEDHGLVMELGIDEELVRGFMSSKELGSHFKFSSIQEGTVLLCLITGFGSNGNIVKLSADLQKAGNLKKGNFLTDAPTIDSFLPGTAVELLISEVTKSGVIGKAMGVLDMTADLIHSGALAIGKELENKYSVGEKVKSRIICTFPDAEPRKLGISLLEHVISLKPSPISSSADSETQNPIGILPLSTIVSEAKVVKVEPGMGLLLDMGVKGIRGYVHISRITDGKIETLAQDTGPYRVGSKHKARVIGYNYMDGLYVVSMEAKVIAQPFLNIEDVQVGQIVKGTIEKLLINESGVSGIIVSIAEGITGLVPHIHFSDIHLQHPEKKFKEGSSVTARVLSNSPAKRQLRLTLKKTLVNSDDEIWRSYDDLHVGAEAVGAIIKIIQSGAVVQFYGSIRGFLPVAEMSESYIEDPKKHFRIGQVIKVRIVSVNAVEKRMIVSCRDPSIPGVAQQEQLQSLVIGSAVNATVTEKANDELVLELQGSKLKAMLPFEHLTDESSQKAHSTAKKIRVGQEIKDLIVLSKAEGKRLVQLTGKPSLVKAAHAQKLVKGFEDIREGAEVDGYVSNIIPSGVFVQFAGGISGLLPKAQLSDEAASVPHFGMRKHQSISARVLSVDYAQERFLLSRKSKSIAGTDQSPSKGSVSALSDGSLSNPVDGFSINIDDFCLGKLTKAKIDSVKQTQLNVHLADGVQGRIDMSEVYDKLEDVKDRKHPLKSFRPQEVLSVRILGIHDFRNHKFLPITHRGKAPVFELTAKPSNQTTMDLDILTLSKVHTSSSYLVFINNVAEDYVWVSLSPNVRGRIKALDLSDDVSLLQDLGKNFPVGRALQAKVLNVDVTNDRLDLSARSGDSARPFTFSDLSVGAVLPGRVTKVTERQVTVQLSESLSGQVNLADLSDDYSTANPTIFKKNQIVRVCVRHIDAPNKRVYLSTRPSKVLSSSLPVDDREIRNITDLAVNDVVRGFVKNVADNGVFVSLGSNVTAFVRVSDLSDLFLKDWKSDFVIDQLVKGKIIEVDAAVNHIRMSLKKSHIDKNYRPPLTFNDMRTGQVVTGKIRKVEDFGVFIVIDNSANVSGLCHRTQMANGKMPDPHKLYDEGDIVKAKVLKIDRERKRMSFGLKASLFRSEIDADFEGGEDAISLKPSNTGDHISDEGTEVGELRDVLAANADEGSSDWGGVEDERDEKDDAHIDDADYGGVCINGESNAGSQVQGLHAGGFDWTGGLSVMRPRKPQSETDAEASQPKKKKRKKAEIQVDRTGDLDAHGPQSVADYERLLLGQPNSSVLWLSYMAYQLQLSEVDKARELGERALRTIHIREQDEKLNVWVALLNLENTYGTEETLDQIFGRACQYCDSLDIHERMISIYIQSGNHERADALFSTTLSKHGSQSPSLWLNAATFYLSTLNAPSRARQLLSRALQSLPSHTHLQLMSKFAQLEFTSPNGDPERGRTAFEGLLTTFPKRLDLWNVLLDLEIRRGEKDRVRELFGRVTRLELKIRKMKYWFKIWAEWEEKMCDEKGREKVAKLAEEYVRKQAEEKVKIAEL